MYSSFPIPFLTLEFPKPNPKHLDRKKKQNEKKHYLLILNRLCWCVCTDSIWSRSGTLLMTLWCFVWSSFVSRGVFLCVRVCYFLCGFVPSASVCIRVYCAAGCSDVFQPFLCRVFCVVLCKLLWFEFRPMNLCYAILSDCVLGCDLWTFWVRSLLHEIRLGLIEIGSKLLCFCCDVFCARDFRMSIH